MNVGPFRLLGMHTGKPGGAGARMVSRAIAQGLAVVLFQAGQHQQPVAKRFHGLQRGSELKTSALGLRRPVPHDDAVGGIDEDDPRDYSASGRG